MDAEVGQLVAPGDELARVSDPTHLKAELKIPEALVNDVAVGQRGEVDTRNGVIEGAVSRIDPVGVRGDRPRRRPPARRNAPPRPARPQRGRDDRAPAAREGAAREPPHRCQERRASRDSSSWRVTKSHASRVQVQVGKVSVSTTEIRSGLSDGRQGGPRPTCRRGPPTTGSGSSRQVSIPQHKEAASRSNGRFNERRCAADPPGGPIESLLHRRGRDARALGHRP